MTSAFASTRGVAVLARVEPLGRQARAAARRSRAERLADRQLHARRSAGSRSCVAAVLEQPRSARPAIATSGTGTRWLRRKRPTSPSTPPFSCAPCDPRPRELRLEQVVRAQRDEPVGLDPAAAPAAPASPPSSGCRSGSAANTPPNHSNASTCPSRNACCVCALRTPHTNAAPENQARITNRYTVRRCTRDQTTSASPQSTSASTPGLVHHAARTPRRAARPARRRRRRTYSPHLSLSATSAPVLVDEPPPDPLRRMTLLARRLPIRPQATRRSAPGTRPASAPAAPPAPLRRRQRRRQRLPHRPPMHPMPLRQRPDRQAPPDPGPA